VEEVLHKQEMTRHGTWIGQRNCQVNQLKGDEMRKKMNSTINIHIACQGGMMDRISARHELSHSYLLLEKAMFLRVVHWNA
jgi:hypothetical protein